MRRTLDFTTGAKGRMFSKQSRGAPENTSQFYLQDFGLAG
jgi:hypothetical protein